MQIYENNRPAFTFEPSLPGSRQISDSKQMPTPLLGEKDEVELSEQARRFLKGSTAGETSQSGESLDENDQAQVRELKSREREVVAHEMAHMSAGGGVVSGGARYEYQMGPDGKRYIVGGEVKVDIGTESTPEATVIKMEQVKRAALAPADPSPQDRAVAAAASQIEMQAKSESTTQSTSAKKPPIQSGGQLNLLV